MCIILPSSVRFRTYTFHSRLLSGFLGSHRHGLCLTHLVPPGNMTLGLVITSLPICVLLSSIHLKGRSKPGRRVSMGLKSSQEGWKCHCVLKRSEEVWASCRAGSTSGRGVSLACQADPKSSAECFTRQIPSPSYSLVQ